MGFNMIIYNKMQRDFIGPDDEKGECARVLSMGWIQIDDNLANVWKKNKIVAALVEQGCLVFQNSENKKVEAAPAQKTVSPKVKGKLSQELDEDKKILSEADAGKASRG